MRNNRKTLLSHNRLVNRARRTRRTFATRRKALASRTTIAINIRESMRCLANWLQPVLTELTGKPLSDEPMVFQWRWWSRLALTLVVMVASVVGTVLIIESAPYFWVLLPATWVLTTSAARSFQTTFVHHASHDNLSRRKRLNTIVGEVLSTLVWIQPLSLYKADHLPLHHGNLALADDPDLRFLVLAGLRPGLTIDAYWRWLANTLVSPRFHGRYFMTRMRSNFVDAPAKRKLVVILYTAALLAIVSLTDTWFAFAIAWLIPVFPLYHVSALLQLLTKHNWVRQGHGKDNKRVVLSRLTTARYVGESTPTGIHRSLPRMLAWIRWGLRMIFIHAAVRLFVVPGDLPNHHYHHLQARGDWPNAAYASRDYWRNSTGAHYRVEHWGLTNWLNATFKLLAELPPDAKLGEPTTYGNEPYKTSF